VIGYHLERDLKLKAFGKTKNLLENIGEGRGTSNRTATVLEFSSEITHVEEIPQIADRKHGGVDK
jgi:hypothetical protein